MSVTNTNDGQQTIINDAFQEITQRKFPSVEKISEINLTQEDDKKDIVDQNQFYNTKGTGESIKHGLKITDSQDIQVLKSYNEAINTKHEYESKEKVAKFNPPLLAMSPGCLTPNVLKIDDNYEE